jgi:hypothetical protein
MLWQHRKKTYSFEQVTQWSAWRWCNKHRNMQEVIGDKYMYLTNYVHSVGIKRIYWSVIYNLFYFISFYTTILQKILTNNHTNFNTVE